MAPGKPLNLTRQALNPGFGVETPGLAAFGNNLVDDDVDIYENEDDKFRRTLRYDFPDQGNGMRLQIETVHDNLAGYWTMQMRRGNKDDEAFFDAAFKDV
ncbi:hypothetical protein AAVH_31544 [Aphelenchoides avenae]|nr:hypothetical protein AAVH_31544 [Aphelenchus avenae]